MSVFDDAMKKVRTDSGRYSLAKAADGILGIKRDIATALALLRTDEVGQANHERILGAYQDAALLSGKLQGLSRDIDAALGVLKNPGE